MPQSKSNLEEALKVAVEACRVWSRPGGLVHGSVWDKYEGAAAALEKLRANIRWAEERIAKIEADERYHYPKANTFVNAPLALIQLQMEVEHAICVKLARLEQEEGKP